jgi:drug/metabolite transporter (DMT)-like permease
MKSKPYTLPGVVFVIAAVACFAALDTATKFVSLSAPMVMTVRFRYLFQALVTGVWLLPRRNSAAFKTHGPVLPFVRGCRLLASSSLAFLSLRYWVFGHVPKAMALLGMLMIAVCGALVLWSRGSSVAAQARSGEAA